MIRFKLTIAYDGTRYAGWQVQKLGTGVQEIVEHSLRELVGAPVRLHSASRTDTGVHAIGMVAHVDLPRARVRMPTRKLPLAINARLPEDVRVLAAAKVAPGFHARFHAVGKEYRYFIWNHPVMNPLERHRAWHVPVRLNLEAMRAAARRLVGTRDFRSFAANRNYAMPDTVRTLTACEVRRSGASIVIRIRGDGFLYKMCRGIVGTLVQVGQGKFMPEEVERILECRDRRVAGMTAPPQGLVLWRVLHARRSRGGQPARHDPE